MRKFFKNIHLWLSVPVGVIITIICLTGSFLFFETEIMEALYPDRYFIKEVSEKPIPIDKLITNVSKEIPDSVSITGVTIPSDPKRAYIFSLSKPRRASVYVDQYSGNIKFYNQRSQFFMTVFRLHRWLLDSAKSDGSIFWGKVIVGSCTLIFVFIIITGLIIWVPKTLTATKNRLKINFNKGWRRFIYDLHVAGGFYISILLLIMALTGLTWSFQWYRQGFYKVLGSEMLQAGPPPSAQQKQQGNDNRVKEKEERKTDKPQADFEKVKQNISKEDGTAVADKQEERGTRANEETRDSSNRENKRGNSSLNFQKWQQVYDELAYQNPKYTQITLSNGNANVFFSGWGNQRAGDKYTFNPKNGEITDSDLYKNQNKQGKIRGWIFSLHVGSWGGYFSKILTLIAALIGATLPITGYYFWLNRIIKKNKRKTLRG